MGSEDDAKTAERKRDLIEEKQGLSPASLIYSPPDHVSLYSIAEMKYLLAPLARQRIPRKLGHVQKSHFVKKKALQLLGYIPPKGFRTKEARAHRPRFIHQLMDIFVQSSNNLQVWNYIPSVELPLPYEWNNVDKPVTFADCRYVIVMHKTSGEITKILIKTGRDLAAWDRTGTKTMKWQATITVATRVRHKGKLFVGADRLAVKLRHRRSVSPIQKTKAIRANDRDPHRALIKQKPDVDLLYTMAELEELVRPLLGWKMRDPGSYGTRPVGQNFEKELAARLGYVHVDQTDTGDIPDLLHQLLEAKFQYSPTIDLGRHLPVDRARIEERWNDLNLQPRDLRYLIAFGGLVGDYYVVEGMVLVSGAEFGDHFSLVEGQSFKVQLTIPSEDLKP